MRIARTLIGSTLLLLSAVSCLALTRAHSIPTSSKLFHKHSKKKASLHPTGQRTIDDARAGQIQTSLIKSGYLSGEASGRWDAKTQAAMERYQGDNGWQTKLVPDSRAIIKLGLGPSQGTSPKINAPGSVAPAESASAIGTVQKQ